MNKTISPVPSPRKFSARLPLRRPAHRGFAIVSVLTILVLILILLLTISSVLHVETRTSGAAKHFLLARQNALLGLDTAIAQLQEYAGKDQAVTFPATTYYPTKDLNVPGASYPAQGKGDIFDNSTYGFRKFAQTSSARSYLNRVETYLTPAERQNWDKALKDYWNANRNPYWIGIMDASLRVDRATNPNSAPVALPAQRFEDPPVGPKKFGEPKRDQLPVWLVSGNEKFSITGNMTSYPPGYQTPDTALPDPKDDKNVVWLVGNGSVSNAAQTTDRMEPRVKVKKVEVKTTANGTATGHYAYWVGDESLKANFAVRDPFFNAAPGSIDYRNRLQSPQRLGWENISANGTSSNKTLDSLATFTVDDPNLENITTSKEIALLEAAASGSEQKTSNLKEATKNNFHSLTAWSRSLLTDTALGGLKKDLTAYLERGDGLNDSDPIPDASLYAPNDPRFRAWNGTNSGFPNSKNNIPTWGQVRSWSNNVAPKTGDGSITPSRDVAPVLAYMNFHTGLSYDPASKEIRLHWIPMITLWNPYDVGLATASYDIDVGYSPQYYSFFIASSGVAAADVTITTPSVDGAFRGNTPPGPGQEKDFFYAPRPIYNQWNNKSGNSADAYFIANGGDNTAVFGGNLGVITRWNPMRDRDTTSTRKNDAVTQPHPTRYIAVDQTMKFRITASFGPCEALVFTLGKDPDDTHANWTPDQRLLLKNEMEPDFPASAWWPVFKIENNGPVADDSKPHGLSRDMRWRADMEAVSFSSPYFRLAFAGDNSPISESFETGYVQYDHILRAHSSNVTHSPNTWFRRIPRTDRFIADFKTQSDNLSGVGSAYRAFRVWGQPVTFSPPGNDQISGMPQIEVGFPAFSRMNVTRNVDTHPLVEFKRSRFDVNNTDMLNSWTPFQGGPSSTIRDIRWDENQFEGNRGFAIITPRIQPKLTDRHYKPLSKLAYRLARRAGSEILSLGQLQQVNLSPFIWQPSFPIANSEASPYADREAIAGIHSRPVGVLNSLGNAAKIANDEGNRMIDLSYLLNENLWDRYFLSTIKGSLDFSKPLANSRLRFTAQASIADPSAIRSFDTSAAYLENFGALNVNSTSVEAWKALLTAFRDLSLGDNPDNTVPVARTLDPISGAITMGFNASGADINASHIGATASERNYSRIFSGFRYLTDAMIQALAERIVDEVRLRGPFLSLADFVNRRLVAPSGSNQPGSDWYVARTDGRVGPNNDNHNDFIKPSYDPFIGLQGINGALQRAIQVAGINGGVNHPSPQLNDWAYSLRIRSGGNEDNTTTSYSSGSPIPANSTHKNVFEPTIRMHLDTEHWAGAPAGEAGQTMQGLPGFITQGDILAMIGPALTPRGDTFLIRTYGDAVDINGRVLARAYLEAVVQRVAEPVKPKGDSGLDKWTPTNKFGRKFKVVSLRWLNPEEV